MFKKIIRIKGEPLLQLQSNPNIMTLLSNQNNSVNHSAYQLSNTFHNPATIQSTNTANNSSSVASSSSGSGASSASSSNSNNNHHSNNNNNTSSNSLNQHNNDNNAKQRNTNHNVNKTNNDNSVNLFYQFLLILIYFKFVFKKNQIDNKFGQI